MCVSFVSAGNKTCLKESSILLEMIENIIDRTTIIEKYCCKDLKLFLTVKVFEI